ncbi:MAG: xanthine dehydrogenase family protein [Ruminococcus sp.]|nr:xanthine dehydrogenase family protein [Ruminococcus sp.]
MKPICDSIKKKDHDMKIEGRSVYVDDYNLSITGKPILCGRLIHSPYARARVLGVHVPTLPEGYYYVDRNDVPGDNNVNIVLDDTPIFCRETVEYIGEPVGMIVGPDEKVVDEILAAVKVDYEELEPMLDLRGGEEFFFNYEFGHGDMEKAFADADKIYEEEFITGYQDQTYLEPQGMMAEPEEDGRMFVHGSLQCPYYVHGAVARAMGTGPDGVHILQDVTGGGFGGKEDFPSILGCQVAVAAHKAGQPVRCVYNRREDLEFTPKRHPSLSKYKVAVKDGRVTAVDADVRFDAGAYSTLSAVVLQRGIIAAPGIYDIPNVHVTGKAVKTNTAPCGAYRGFGAPQTFFAMETMMSHIAQDLGEDSIAFKAKHFVKQGDMTSTQGRYHFPVPVPAMLDEVDKLCDLRRKHIEYSKPQTGRYRKGIGLGAVFHGAGFTGSGERDIIKAVAKLRKYKDGTVEVLASNGDIGQGVRTTFPKIVAHELNIPLEKVFYDHPDTGRVPDSGPTVASRSLMTVGELLRRAAIKLRGIWKDGEEQEVEEHYREPDFMIPFYLDRFEGDAYPTYAWALGAVEVEVDTYTGLVNILGAYGSFDVGTPVDYNIVLGQMEGGFLQGLGYASIEKMSYDSKGRIRNNSFTDYLVPTTMDVPKMVATLHVEEYPDGPYGAKGAGELPLVSPAPAYIEAVEMALGGAKKHPLNFIPFNQEDVIRELNKEAL